MKYCSGCRISGRVVLVEIDFQFQCIRSQRRKIKIRILTCPNWREVGAFTSIDLFRWRKSMVKCITCFIHRKASFSALKNKFDVCTKRLQRVGWFFHDAELRKIEQPRMELLSHVALSVGAPIETVLTLTKVGSDRVDWFGCRSRRIYRMITKRIHPVIGKYSDKTAQCVLYLHLSSCIWGHHPNHRKRKQRATTDCP